MVIFASTAHVQKVGVAREIS